jgi:hypothetical protein
MAPYLSDSVSNIFGDKGPFLYNFIKSVYNRGFPGREKIRH